MAVSKADVGEVAPEFTALGTGDRSYSLGDYRGRPVVLVFYPGDATPVCTIQLKSYTNGIDQFAALDAQVLGISPQNVDSHEKFSSAQNLAFPLLYDEGKSIGESYGVLGPLGFYRRSVFVINGEGKIAYAKRNINNALFVSTDKLVDAVKAAVDSAAT